MLDNAENALPGIFRFLIERLLDHLRLLDQQVDEIKSQIKQWHRYNEASQQLAQILDIGPLTATAMLAHGRDYRPGYMPTLPSIYRTLFTITVNN